LILTLADDRDCADAALVALREDPCFELGAQEGRRLAVALDTPDEATNKRRWRWLRAQPGVAFVDLLFVHLDDDASASPDDPDPMDRTEPTRAGSRSP
jgi:hypothetical protein